MTFLDGDFLLERDIKSNYLNLFEKSNNYREKAENRLFGYSCKASRPKTMVVLGGNAIWINKYETGVMAGSLKPFKNACGDKIVLQRDAAIKKGDIILNINDKSVNTIEDILKILSGHEGELLTAEIERNFEKMKLELALAKQNKDRKYELGLKDFELGVGHLTFMNPETMEFAALGHSLLNEYNFRARVNGAIIFEAEVLGAEKAARGRIGELDIGERGKIIGKMKSNGNYGAFGKITSEEYFSGKEIVPVASKKEVENGEAFVLCNVKGKATEKYSAEIRKLGFLGFRGLAVHITDPRLIESTGGIIYGMSGSPILQNGQLVGAISHTSLVNPKRGFGVYAQSMLDELHWRLI